MNDAGSGLRLTPNVSPYLEHNQQVPKAERQKRLDYYKNLNEGQKTEFFDGEVLIHPPHPLNHVKVGKSLLLLLDSYVVRNQLGFVGYEKTMISLSRNDYEPDICFFRPEKAQHFTPDQVRFPAPDFVAEVLSPNTEENDRTIKMIDYAAHGVEEYWIIDPKQEFLEQYILRGEDYHLQAKAYDGLINSSAVTGFILPVRALFDEKENLDEIKKTINS